MIMPKTISMRPIIVPMIFLLEYILIPSFLLCIVLLCSIKRASSRPPLYSFYRALSSKRAYNIILYRGENMISYEPLYKTLHQKQISTYKLITDHGISRSLLDRLKHNRPISTVTLNDLCRILQCKVEDILVYVED